MMVSHIDREILVGFVEEARGYLPRILTAVDAFAADPDIPGPLEEAHRLMHSIKGASSMIGLAPLSRMADCAEDALDQATLERPDSAVDLAAATHFAVERIAACLDRVARDEPQDGQGVAEVVRAFRRYRNLPEGESSGEDAVESVTADRFLSRAGEPARKSTFAAPAEEDGLSTELMETFREEAAEHLQEASHLLRRLEVEPADRKVLQELRRRIHTLKGAAALVGQPRVAGLAHSMEDLLDILYEGAGRVSSEVVALLLRGVDGMEDLALGRSPALSDAALMELGQRFATLAASAEEEERQAPLPPADLAPSPDPERTREGRRTGEPGAGASVRVPLERLDELVRFVTDLVVHRSVFEQYLARLTAEAAELGTSGGRLRRLSSRLESEYEVEALASSRWGGSPLSAIDRNRGRSARGLDESFDPLELDRYTQFHLLTRELAETSSDISTVERELGATRGDFEAYLNRLERLTSEVQGRLLQLRLVPFQTLASRLHRTVRTTAEQRGKLVDLVLEGERTELDRNVLSKVADPLLHLLRNAVDHGIETPAERLALGKAAYGRIRVSAAQEGTQIVIRVEDNGGGIDLPRIAEKLSSSGRRTGLEGESLTPEGAFEFLFEPGFSTADEVSQISGRGVGLDVVRSEIQKLKGSVSIVSTPGVRTAVTIRLPLTLAVMRVLLVKVAGEAVAIPFAAVTRILRFETADLEVENETPVVRFEERSYPLHDLAGTFGENRPAAGDRDHFPVLFLQSGTSELALRVDELAESREVVVKSLGSLLQRVPGVSGATVLGDGSVVLILDPAELAAEPSRTGAAPQDAPRPLVGLDVMVVDDSLSVRRVLSNLVRDAGWNPIAARDGVEALEILQRSTRAPDVILLDIEMPRMDGYELTATLRGQAAFRQVPILMLTSRSGEKHRRKAFELGVTEYLVKPFEEDTLLSIVRRIVGGEAGAPAA